MLSRAAKASFFILSFMPTLIHRPYLSIVSQFNANHDSALRRIFQFSCLLVLISACAQQKEKELPIPPHEPLPKTHIESTKQLDEETLYTILVAELALVREHYELGLANYAAQSEATQDVNITARAAQISRILNRHDKSLELAERWHELDPGNREARLILISEYVYHERFSEAFDEASQLLKAGETAGFEEIAIEAVQKGYSGLDTLSDHYKTLLNLYPDNIELLIGSGVLLQASKDLEPALAYIRRAREIAPENARAVYQEYRILKALELDEEATETYGHLVALQPNNFRARSRYAHMLIRVDMPSALEQYTILHNQSPQNNDVLLNLALIQLDQGKFDQAKGNFETLLERNEHLQISNYGLAEVARANENLDTALTHYMRVDSGSRYVDAASKAAVIITQNEGFEDALTFLAKRREKATNEDKESLFLIEADTLNKAGQPERAIATYDLGIQRFPDSVTLLYSRAMHFATQGEVAAAEIDFKRILEHSPENAATLNALGYTLLDLTDRITEAGRYIRQAYALQPDDPAIIDSMGWLEYKLGNLRKAQTLLERALELYMDDEIAAHLGEVLWVQSQKRHAKKIWRRGLDHDPDSEVIKATINRLGVKWP